MSTTTNQRGKKETEQLRANISDQLNRLLTQVEDLEVLKDEFELDEYEETKKETFDMLSEFQIFLSRTLQGDISLIDEFGSAQLAIQAAVSQAFKTPEVIRLFATKQPGQLRLRLSQLQRDIKIKKLNKDQFNQQTCEILLALQKLGEKLSDEELHFLSTQSVGVSLENAIVDIQQKSLLSTASTQIHQAQV